jgi:hypothetical protein
MPAAEAVLARREVAHLGHDLSLFVPQRRRILAAVAIAGEHREAEPLQRAGRQFNHHLPGQTAPGTILKLKESIEARALVAHFAKHGEPVRLGHDAAEPHEDIELRNVAREHLRVGGGTEACEGEQKEQQDRPPCAGQPAGPPEVTRLGIVHNPPYWERLVYRLECAAGAMDLLGSGGRRWRGGGH